MCVSGILATWYRPHSLRSQAEQRELRKFYHINDDAWQARVLSLHQGCCRSARGGGGGALVPGTSLLLASCPHQALLNVQEVHAPPMPIGASDRRLPQASVSPPLPLGAGSPGDPGISSVLQSRQERWQL